MSRSNQHGINQETGYKSNQQTAAFTLPPVKMASMCADTLNLRAMGKQLKEHFLTGIQPKGINNDFLPCAASQRALLGQGRGLCRELRAAGGKTKAERQRRKGSHRPWTSRTRTRRAVWKFKKAERVKSAVEQGQKCNMVLQHIKRERGADRERRAFQEHCSYVTTIVKIII